jgi:hypothetical protein
MSQRGFPLRVTNSQIELSGEGKEKKWYATVRILNQTTGLELDGVSEASYHDEKGLVDQFARTKAHSKAERNAIRKQIPERMITKAIEDAKKKNQIQKLEPANTISDLGKEFCMCSSDVIAKLDVAKREQSNQCFKCGKKVRRI